MFPHIRSLGEPDELEEERRLAYVGITRARERLYVATRGAACCSGSTQYNPPSRFLDEIPSELVSVVDRRRAHSRAGVAASSYRSDGGGRHEGFVPSSEAGRDRIVGSGDARRAASGNHRCGTLGLRVGDDVRHVKFGEGVILGIEGGGDKAEAIVRFSEVGEKRLLLSWAPSNASAPDPCAAPPRQPAVVVVESPVTRIELDDDPVVVEP